MALIQLDVDKLFSAVDKARTSAGASWRELASDLELSPSTFTRLRSGGAPSADALVTLVEFVQRPLSDYHQEARDG